MHVDGKENTQGNNFIPKDFDFTPIKAGSSRRNNNLDFIQMSDIRPPNPHRFEALQESPFCDDLLLWPF